MNMAGTRMLVHFNDIVSKARLYNAAHDISGFLMFDQRRFHQILEGPTKEVDALFARIEADQRHSNVKLLKRDMIKVSTFENWSMGSFLYDTAVHPLQKKHGIVCCECIEPDTLLNFSQEFIKANAKAA
jgi:Sensors of blue-light using FAD